MTLLGLGRGRLVCVAGAGHRCALVLDRCGGDSARPQPIFTGMLVADSFTVVLRVLLLLFAMLFATFTQIAGGLRRRRHDRVLRAHARRAAGHVPDDLGQPHADRVAGRRDGQRALLRAGRHAAEPAQEQRSRLEIRRFRRRHGRRDALRHQPAGRRARLGPPADDGRPAGRIAPRAGAGPPTRRWCWSSAA